MIRNSCIAFNDDGTEAWLVFEVVRPLTGVLPYYRHLDRPCDTCGGLKVIELRPYGRGNERRCPDCDGTGRHTFTVEVVVRHGRYDDRPSTYFNTFRVSVVPDTVLPIYDECADMKPPDHICQAYRDERWIWHSDHKVTQLDPTEVPITLPPAAKPGMWAVQLKVHR